MLNFIHTERERDRERTWSSNPQEVTVLWKHCMLYLKVKTKMVRHLQVTWANLPPVGTLQGHMEQLLISWENCRLQSASHPWRECEVQVVEAGSVRYNTWVKLAHLWGVCALRVVLYPFSVLSDEILVLSGDTKVLRKPSFNFNQVSQRPTHLFSLAQLHSYKTKYMPAQPKVSGPLQEKLANRIWTQLSHFQPFHCEITALQGTKNDLQVA